MFINHLAGFKTAFYENEKAPDSKEKAAQAFTQGAVRDYLGQHFYWDGSTFPITQPVVTIIDSGGKKRSLQGGTFIGLDKNYIARTGKEPQLTDKVPVVIGNVGDIKVPTQTNTAHGKVSKYGGEIITIPYSTYLWMIQPPTPPDQSGGMGGATPPMGGMGI